MSKLLFTFMLCMISTLSYANDIQWKQELLQRILKYSMPGIGIDAKTYQPFDHVRMNKVLGITTNKGYYTAASKNSSYLAFMLKVAMGHPLTNSLDLFVTHHEKLAIEEHGFAVTTQTIALWRMLKNIEALHAFQEGKKDQEKQGGILATGLFPWMVISKKGTLVSDKDEVPILDNAMLSWTFGAIVAGLQSSKHVLAQKLVTTTQKVLSNQRYDLFWNEKNNRISGTYNERTQRPNDVYYIRNYWTEDLMVLMWMIVNGFVPLQSVKDVQSDMEGDLTMYVTRDKDSIYVPKGYVQSVHEMAWGMNFLPYEDTQYKDFLYQMFYHQADYAIKHKKLGFMAVAYDALGTYVKMGIPDTSMHPDYIQRVDCSVAYATGLGVSMFPKELEPWLKSFLSYGKILGPLGPYESVGPEGIPDILTADSQYNIALALMGGINSEVRQYLKELTLSGQKQSGYDTFVSYINDQADFLIEQLPDQTLKKPRSEFPKPLLRFEPVDFSYGMQDSKFDLISHVTVNSDDRHGAFVFNPDDANKQWDIRDGRIEFAYHIPSEIEEERRFAWAGTYMGTERPFLAGFDYVDITIPDDAAAPTFELLLNRENTIVVKPIMVNVQDKGRVSKDGEWKTLRYRLWHIDKYKNLPLTYISFSIPDPFRDERFKDEGSIVIKEIVFSSKKKGKIDLDKAIRSLTLEVHPHFRHHRWPAPAHADLLKFQDSGALGQGTRGETKEENGAVYVEFEDVDLAKGYSGIWLNIEKLDLTTYDYVSFDVMRGPYYDLPQDMVLEFKNDKVLSPLTSSWRYRFDLDALKLTQKKSARVYIPLHDCELDQADIISFVHENWQTGQTKGAYMVANVALHKKEAMENAPKKSRMFVKYL